MAWVINNSYPYQDILKEPIEVFAEPIPSFIMNIKDNEYPSYSHLNLVNAIEEPYPLSLMAQKDNDYPKYTHLSLMPFIQGPDYPIAVHIQKKNEYPYYTNLNLLDTGAFCWALNLEKVIIPKSCKYIGVTAFRHTKLKEVTIAKDCVYFNTSFPEGCEIKFYE